MLAGCADQTRPGPARLSLYRTAQLICKRSLDANIVQLAANGGIGLTEWEALSWRTPFHKSGGSDMSIDKGLNVPLVFSCGRRIKLLNILVLKIHVVRLICYS